MNFKKESYSQCGEDLIIDFFFKCVGIDKPNYIDIGAHHPHFINNTFLFYKKGCRGINVEPNPILYPYFLRYREHDVNLNIGVSSSLNDQLTYYELSSSTLNTFSKSDMEEALANGYKLEREMNIDIVSMNEIIEKYYPKSGVNLVSIDVEGSEIDVLDSLDFSLYRPDLFCIESLYFSNKKICDKRYDAVEYLKSKGYVVYADTHINTILAESRFMS